MLVGTINRKKNKIDSIVTTILKNRTSGNDISPLSEFVENLFSKEITGRGNQIWPDR